MEISTHTRILLDPVIELVVLSWSSHDSSGDIWSGASSISGQSTAFPRLMVPVLSYLGSGVVVVSRGEHVATLLSYLSFMRWELDLTQSVLVVCTIGHTSLFHFDKFLIGSHLSLFLAEIEALSTGLAPRRRVYCWFKRRQATIIIHTFIEGVGKDITDVSLGMCLRPRPRFPIKI